MVQRIGPKKKPKYRVQVRVHGKVEGQVWTRKADAERQEADLKRQQELARAGMARPSEKILFIDFAASWLKAREKVHPKGTTGPEEARFRRYLLAPLGHRPISGIQSQEIRDLLDDIQEEHDLSNATRNRIRAMLHTMFHEAFMQERIALNPIARVPLLKESPERKQPLTRAEIAAFLAAAEEDGGDSPFLAACFLFTGGRISNIAGLQNGDFDPEHREITFNRLYDQWTGEVRAGIKGKPEGIVLPLLPALALAHQTHLRTARLKRPGDYCFADAEGKPRGTYSLRGQVNRIRKLGGVREMGPHVLRATFATCAEEAGFSKEDVQRMLGHTSITVTQRYTRRSAGPLREKAERLGFGALEQGENVVEMVGPTHTRHKKSEA